MRRPPRFIPYETPEQALRAAADLMVALGPESLVLAGGSTPRALYELLASDDYRSRLDWLDLQVWFSDERAVPPGHPDSNYGMARRTLLDLVPVADDAVHRMPAEDVALDAAASRYEATLPDRFDLVLLGMGPDGHTASLFPGTTALEEDERRVVGTSTPMGRRMTLTYPALESARHVLFLVLGAEKRAMLQQIRDGADVPAARVDPADGDVTWIVDRAAWDA